MGTKKETIKEKVEEYLVKMNDPNHLKEVVRFMVAMIAGDPSEMAGLMNTHGDLIKKGLASPAQRELAEFISLISMLAYVRGKKINEESTKAV